MTNASSTHVRHRHDDDPLDSTFARARTAQKAYENFDAPQIEDLVAGVAWCLYAPELVARLSEQAVAESGIGTPADTAVRHRQRVLALMRDMYGRPSVGLVDEQPERGLRIYAKPRGLVAFVCPSTAPVATVVVHALSALKTRNAAIICPHPSTANVTASAVSEIQKTIIRLGGPGHLIQTLPYGTPFGIEDIASRVDFIVATGGAATVRKALSSSTPGLAGGVGNPVTIADDSADLSLVCREVLSGKTFDHGTSCSAESCIVTLHSKASSLRAALASRGAHLMTELETTRVGEVIWPQGGKLNRKVVGRSAAEIADLAAVDVAPGTRALVSSPLPDPYALLGREKLCPVLGLATVGTFSEALDFCQELIDQHGRGHSAAIYSESRQNISAAAERLNVSRLMINQSTGLGNTGRPDNGMRPSVVLACGSWGGTTSNDNITWRDLLNYTTVSEVVATAPLREAQVFGRFWRAAE